MKSQYFRTFIAVPVQVDERFLEARRHLMESLAKERISWTNPDQYHVTLRFIGDTEVSAVNNIKNSFQQELHLPEQIRLETGGLASFGPRKKPRVIWVGFEENSFFESLKFEVDHVLGKCGIPLTDQPFRAHLTLGRVRSLRDRQGYYHIIGEMAKQFSSSVVLDRLVFFRSILGPMGPQYHVLKQMQFLP